MRGFLVTHQWQGTEIQSPMTCCVILREIAISQVRFLHRWWEKQFLRCFLKAHFSQSHSETKPKRQKALYPWSPIWVRQRREGTFPSYEALLQLALAVLGRGPASCLVPLELSLAAFDRWSRRCLFLGRLEARVAYRPIRHFEDVDLPFSETEVWIWGISIVTKPKSLAVNQKKKKICLQCVRESCAQTPFHPASVT